MEDREKKNGGWIVQRDESKGSHQKKCNHTWSGRTRKQMQDGRGENRGQLSSMRQNIQSYGRKDREERHTLLPKDWRKGTGKDANPTGHEIREYQSGIAGRCAQTTEHRVQKCEHMPRPNEETAKARDKPKRTDGTEEQEGAYGRRQGKKLAMDGHRPERRKKSGKSPDPGRHPTERNWLEEREQQRRPEEQQIPYRRKQRGQAEPGQEQQAHGARQQGQKLAGKKEPDRIRGREGGRTAQAQAQTVKILYTNAQSFSSKLGELTAVTLDTKPDIILLTETLCNEKISDAALTLDGFKLETELRKDKTVTRN
jgi:hypothetical protein